MDKANGIYHCHFEVPEQEKLQAQDTLWESAEKPARVEQPKPKGFPGLSCGAIIQIHPDLLNHFFCSGLSARLVSVYRGKASAGGGAGNHGGCHSAKDLRKHWNRAVAKKMLTACQYGGGSFLRKSRWVYSPLAFAHAVLHFFATFRQ